MEERKAIRVLLVDDEDRFRETTALVLKRRGFEVGAAANGVEAVEEVKTGDYDVAILDVKMPGLDGNQTLRELKRIKPELQIIMLTGHGTPDSARRGLAEGVHDYLAKPCNLELLASKVKDAYARKNRLTEEERLVKDVMVPLSFFNAARENQSVAEAVEKIIRSFELTQPGSPLQEGVHTLLLVLDQRDRAIGSLDFSDLIQAMQPGPSSSGARPAGSAEVSGLFTVLARDLAKKTVREVMPQRQPLIPADKNLMAALSLMIAEQADRLLVTERDEVIGVLRSQDLFLEMANIISQYV